MNDAKDVIKLELPAKGEYLSLIRLTASSVAARMGFNIDDIDDIKVSIGEACTSLLENLNSSQENEFKIEYAVDEDKLKVKININANEDLKELESENIKTQNTIDVSEGSLGMMIIQSLMDDVEVSDLSESGTEIKMMKIKRDE